MKIKKDIDVTKETAPKAQSGTNFFENPQITPPGSIAMDPGEKETGEVTEFSRNRPQPIPKKGMGYV